MPEYKVVNATQLDSDMESLADSIRAKAGVTEKLAFPAGMKAAVDGIQTGSDPVIQPLSVTANGTYTAPEGVDGYSPVTVNVPSSGGGGSLPSVSPKEVNFYDYDGTVLYAYTVEDAAALTELPALPEHDGLICQGWNWTLDEVKSVYKYGDVGAIYTTYDGKTRIYITLTKGRTSPMLGCCPNGTVTVDWGDGTEPDVLTGTSETSVKWTPTHEYAAPGDYTITLTVDGTMGIYGDTASNSFSGLLRESSNADVRNRAYLASIKKIEIGDNVTQLCGGAFYYTVAAKSITLSKDVKIIGARAFSNSRVNCIVIPRNFMTNGDYIFASGSSIKKIVFPYEGSLNHTHIFYYCSGITELRIPKGAANITKGTFNNCAGLRYLYFTDHEFVPSLTLTDTFDQTASDLYICIPAALVEEWKAATNWSSIASKIMGA